MKKNGLRWYWQVSILLFLELFIAPMLPGVFLDDPNTLFDDDGLFDLFVASQVTVFVTAVVWTTWICPFIHARDSRVEWRHTPKTKLSGLILYLWAPPVVAVVNATALTIGTVTGWMFSPASIPSLIFFWSLAVLALAAAIIMGIVLKDVVIRQAQLRQLCFNCGYDVRLIESPACPECGEPIPPFESSAA